MGSNGVEKVVVVVEDDLDIREAIREILDEEGYEVFTAGNGQEALELLANIPRPRLILLDLMMPVMDGHQFLEICRADPAYASIPVVVVSAGITVAPAIAAFIKKPFDTNVLLKTVEKLCRDDEAERIVATEVVTASAR